MDASGKYFSVDLDAQEAPKPKPKSKPKHGPSSVEFEDIDTIDPMAFAALLATGRHAAAAPMKQYEDEDAIEIELSAEQMDAVLAGSWEP